MLVAVAVSSTNTNRAGSNRPCSSIQRRRARATSARFCSAARMDFFFNRDLVPCEKPPNGGAAAGLALEAQKPALVFVEQGMSGSPFPRDPERIVPFNRHPERLADFKREFR